MSNCYFSRTTGPRSLNSLPKETFKELRFVFHVRSVVSCKCTIASRFRSSHLDLRLCEFVARFEHDLHKVFAANPSDVFCEVFVELRQTTLKLGTWRHPNYKVLSRRAPTCRGLTHPTTKVASSFVYCGQPGSWKPTVLLSCFSAFAPKMPPDPVEDLTILLIGQGGREAALAWKLSQSPRVKKIFCAPGNGGTAKGLNKVQNIDVKGDESQRLVNFAKEHGVNLAVPASEGPLVDGIEAFFRQAGIRCFGPTKEAARMEGSKTFAKDFMKRCIYLFNC